MKPGSDNKKPFPWDCTAALETSNVGAPRTTWVTDRLKDAAKLNRESPDIPTLPHPGTWAIILPCTANEPLLPAMWSASLQAIMERLPISVCLISGAEAPRIRRALDSVSSWTSEIIVVLNQEVKDGTEEIAAGCGAKVYRHPWQGFREQKNLALAYGQQRWILSLDTDEEVSVELRASIEEFVSSRQDRYVGARFARKAWFMGRWIMHGDWYPDQVLRLFERDKGKWGGSPEHCHVKLNGAAKALKGDLLHYSNSSISSYVLKINYFADLFLESQLARKERWSTLPVVVRSAWRFFRAYFVRLGFLDGYPGFFIAASTAYATLVRHSRLYEHLHADTPLCGPPRSR